MYKPNLCKILLLHTYLNYFLVLLASTRTPTTSTYDALYNLALFQFGFRYTADAVCTKVCISTLNTSEAAKVFITLLLPLCYQVFVSISFFQTVFIQLSTDCFSSIEQFIHITRLLVMDSKYWPHGLRFSFSLVRFCLSFSHFLIEFVKCWLNQFPSFRRRFSTSTYFGHLFLLRQLTMLC